MLKPSNNTKWPLRLLKNYRREFSRKRNCCVYRRKAYLQCSPRKPFRSYIFTGSPSVGKTIMQAASKHLASVTLELGGKSPVIVDETVNLNESIPNIIWGKILNAGQTCVGVDYNLFMKQSSTNSLKNLKKQIEEFYGKNQTSWEKILIFVEL